MGNSNNSIAKHQIIQFKKGQKTQTFFPKKTLVANRQMKTCNITTHQRNVNKNHMRYHLTPLRMAIIKKDNKDVEKMEALYTSGAIVYWCSRYEKQYGGSLKN